MPSITSHTMGSDDGNQISQRIWQFLSQLSREGLSQEEFLAKASSYYAHYSSYLPVQEAPRPHHSQLPKLETKLRDFSIGQIDRDADSHLSTENGRDGFGNHVRIVPAREQWGSWDKTGVAEYNQDRMSPGNLERLRAEYERTTREWEAAQMEYEEIYAERQSVKRELKAAMVVKDELAKRRFEIEQRMRGVCV